MIIYHLVQGGNGPPTYPKKTAHNHRPRQQPNEPVHGSSELLVRRTDRPGLPTGGAAGMEPVGHRVSSVAIQQGNHNLSNGVSSHIPSYQDISA